MAVDMLEMPTPGWCARVAPDHPKTVDQQAIRKTAEDPVSLSAMWKCRRTRPASAISERYDAVMPTPSARSPIAC